MREAFSLAYRAWGANVLGMSEVGKWFADQLGLTFTQMVDWSNSLHLYESDFQEIEHDFKVKAKRKGE